MKLGQAIFLGKPILLLDDIFDKLDAERVERIVRLVSSEQFGQIFITDTDRQHLTALLAAHGDKAKVWEVSNGEIQTV
jgi:DNA replication and repair protein RecF